MSRSRSGASRTRRPDQALRDLYCRLLRATDDETFRLGHAIRLEPTAAWPGNATHEGMLARLWVGQHRQLRLGGRQPDRASRPRRYIPLALPEFAGKNVHLDDQLDDVHYDRPGDDLLVRGLYVDLPAYGRHLFRVTRNRRLPAGAAAGLTLTRRRTPAGLARRPLAARSRDYPSGASSSRA